MKERKIRSIMGKYPYKPKRNISIDERRKFNLDILLDKKPDPISLFIGVNPKSKEHIERLTVYQFYYRFGKSDNDITEIWFQVQCEKSQRREDWNFMPKTTRDNLNPKTNTINFRGGGDNPSKIIVPSKKHKSRFKNFMKLFPDYCQRNNISL